MMSALRIHPRPVRIRHTILSGQEAALVSIDLAVESPSTDPLPAVVDLAIDDPEAEELWRCSMQMRIEQPVTGVTTTALLPTPQWWQPDAPERHTLRCEIRCGNEIADAVKRPFAVRSISGDGRGGLLLNGRPLPVRSVRCQADRRTDDLLDWHLRRLRALGITTMRIGHEPINAEVQDLADRAGLLVLGNDRIDGIAIADDPAAPDLDDLLRDLAAWWHERIPRIQLLPHWTWPGRDGQPITMRCLGSMESIELRLNGRSLGRQGSDGILALAIPYEPGELIAIGSDGRGAELARSRICTAKRPSRIELDATARTLDADGASRFAVRARIVDGDGTTCPDGAHLVRFWTTSDDQVQVTAVGIEDGRSPSHDQLAARMATGGVCQVTLRTGVAPGRFMLHAAAEGVGTAALPMRLLPVLRTR